ncbi:hypothetical protein O3G_MSEX002042 [Manduca sexta]|uniref:Uncharacterized protein n=1 Tax=Manduca sexta TaxID=7130 RepID=A0A922CDY0_MANSE|nr:hypothetical protein O3G_MSEX002042 [Manduca sexta]
MNSGLICSQFLTATLYRSVQLLGQDHGFGDHYLWNAGARQDHGLRNHGLRKAGARQDHGLGDNNFRKGRTRHDDRLRKAGVYVNDVNGSGGRLSGGNITTVHVDDDLDQMRRLSGNVNHGGGSRALDNNSGSHGDGRGFEGLQDGGSNSDGG